MSKITFLYEKNQYEMNIENNQIQISDILQNFLKLINQNQQNILFLYKGNKLCIDNRNIFFNQNKKIVISVFLLNKKKNSKEYNYILCPTCYNLLLFNINDDKISMTNCINKHSFLDLSINDFTKSQFSIESKINCNICNNNILLYNHKFYRCSCGKLVCILCLPKHTFKGHYAIEYNRTFFFCNKHNKLFVSFCYNCSQNLCQECEQEHRKHKIIINKSERPSENRIKKMKKELEENILNIEEFEKQIKKLNQLFNNNIIKMCNEYEQYKKLYNKMMYFSDNLYNYETIKNIINFKIEFINKNIIYFLNQNIYDKFMSLIDIIYKKINQANIIYKKKYNKKDEDNTIQLFGNKFVENNKENCFLIIDNKFYDIRKYFDIKENNNKEIILKIHLIEEKIITDMSYMFYNCVNLSSLPDISKWNTNNVTNMSDMFSNCSNLSYLPDIYKWNTNNVTNMSHLFFICENLSTFPDISKWNTYNVTDMSYIFSNCKKLSYLPDISKWNTSNLINMSNMFSNCINLSSLPDISKWNTNKVTDMSYIFSNCKKLSYLPDISKWNTNSVIRKNSMFSNCTNLPSLPNYFK